MNTDEHRLWKQRAAKVAKKGQKQNSLLSLLPSVFFFSFRLVTVGAMVLGSCAVAVAQEQVGGHALATPSIRIWDLAVAGGIFMIPIAGMSLLAVTMAIERLFALRRGRVLPSGLVRGLNELERLPGRFDIEEATELCRRNPSAASNVVRAMLTRAGRPLGEIESAVNQASQREADRLYANVRWLNLAASLSTMLGLIGTIQGMIMAFHRLTVTEVVADRTNMLAAGIYTALITTFAGLFVAIPSLLMSHFFEGKILGLFHQIDEMAFHLLPKLAERNTSTTGAQNGDSATEHRPMSEFGLNREK